MKKALQFVLLSLFFQLSAAAQNVKITQNDLNSDITTRWENVATELGYNASTVPRSILDNNSFFSTTDILIISGGTESYTVAQLNVVKDFLASGKSVYLQGEYLTTYSNNQFFSQIIASYGDSFTWAGTVDGQLGGANMTIVGSLSYLNNSITSLPYFWYGATGISTSTRLIPFVYNGTQPLGWMYNPVNASYGRLMLITDQDWIGRVGQYPVVTNLMKNILYHLKNKTEGDMNYTPPVAPTNGIVYVKKGATGKGNSWANAIGELADALIAAKSNTNIKEIWVAKGIYKPLYRPDNLSGTNPNDRDNAFLLVDNVKLYGGFAGTETAINQRVLPANGATGTILSGDLGTVNNITDNTYHVVMAVGTPTLNTFIDGFEIRGGNANGGFTFITVKGINVFRNDGGGIYSEASNWSSFSSPYSSTITLSNSNITQNTANGRGGSIFSIANLSSSVIVNNSAISQNTAGADGGGIYSFSLSNSSSSTVTVNNSNISQNTANQGGGIFSYGNNSSSTSSVKVNNSSVSGNTATTNGGAIYSQSSSANTINLISSTIAGNKGSSFAYFNSGTKTFKVANSIIYGNTKSDNTASGMTGSGSAITKTITYSLVQGEAADATNGVLDGATTSAHTTTKVFKDFIGGDYSLKTGSPAIGTGSNSLYTDNGGNLAADKDLAGSPRLTGSNIDMGAYEALVQSQTINPIAAISKTYGDAAFEPGAKASSGLSVSYASADNSIAEAYQDNTDNNRWKLNIKKAGTVNITASQVGGNGYEPAPDVVFNLTISQKPVTVSIKPDAIFTKVYDAGTAGTVQVTDLGLANGDVLNGDDVQLSLSSATAQYDTKDAGTAKKITLPIASVVLTGAQAGNYKVANMSDLSNTTAAITPKPLAITANNFSKVYDGAAYSGGNGVSYGVFALGEDPTVLDGTLVYGGTSQGAIGTGSYAIVPSGLSSPNYTISYADGQLSISLNNVNVLTFNAQTAGSTLTRTYGDADINASAIASSGLTANYQSSNPAVASVNASGQVSLLQTGTAAITVNQAGDTNYGAASPISFQVQVVKKLLTVTANDFSKTYDGIAYAGGNGVSYSGFANGEGPSVLDGMLGYGGNSQGAVNTGNYSITPSGLAATNYDFDYKNGTLGIVQSGANVITFNNQVAGATQQLTYGSATIDASAIASSGLVISYSSSNLAVASVNTFGQVQILAAGTATITASQPGDGNHTAAVPVSFTVNVQQKALTITANNFNKVYDGQVYTTSNGVAYHGFVNGENEQHLQGSLSYAGTAIGAKNVGSYFITPGGYTSANYAITYQDGSLTISKANLTVTADAKTKVYGSSDPTLTYKVTGMVNNDAATVVTGTLKRATGENVGTYAISNNDLAASNYTITYVGSDLTITKANLTVTADAKTKVYGTNDPALTYKVTGMVNNDAATVVTGTLKRATGENVGTYAISNNDLTASNYTINYIGANLTITKATISGITLSDASFTYDAAAKSILIAGTLPAGTTVSYTGNNQTAAGTYAITATIDGGINYTNLTLQATLKINKAKQVITFKEIPAVYRDAGTLSLDISSNSPLPIKIYSDNTLVAEVTGNQEVTVRGVGLALIRAEQSGDANYIAADAVTRELRVRNEDGAKLPVRVHPAVSPNGDGINDYLRIEGIDEYPENKIGIFDANGNLVQELKGYDNHSNRFDGYKESRAVPAGTYFYMLEVKINGKWVYDKGFFVVRY